MGVNDEFQLFKPKLARDSGFEEVPVWRFGLGKSVFPALSFTLSGHV